MSERKIFGNSISINRPRPDLMDDNPKSGAYVHGKEEFLKNANVGGSGGGAYRVTLTPVEYDVGNECFVCEVDKTAEEITAALENGSCVTAVYHFVVGEDATLPIDVPYATYLDDGDDPIIVFSKSVTLATDTLFISVLYMPLIGCAMVYVTENTGEANLTRAEEVCF